MIQFVTQLDCHFTDADKEKCLPTIQNLMELANLARTKGILALNVEIQQMPSLFLQTGMLLVVDGIEPNTVKHILQNLLTAEKFSGAELLERLLMTEAVLAIQQGESPYIIEMKLRSILGEKYITAAKESFSAENEKMRKYNDFLKILKDKEALPESAPFETIFKNLYSQPLQHIIHHIDIRDLTLALAGCGYSLIHKVLENVSMNTCLRICEDLEQNISACAEDILAAQIRITDTYEVLIKKGEIVAPTDANVIGFILDE